MAERLRADPRLIERARANLERWLQTCSAAARPALEEWRRQLDAPLEEVLALLAATDERAVRLRQSSPFAGVLPAGERTRILREFHEPRAA